MNEITAKKEPIQDKQIIQPLKEKDIINIQMKDPFCSKIIKQLENKKAVVGSPYYCEGLKPPLESFFQIDHAVTVMSNNY